MSVDDLYSTRIQKTFDEDNAEIISIMKANSKARFKLLNYYKGLPLTYPAEISSVDRGVVDMAVKEEQAFAIEQNRSAFIRSTLFKHDVFAQSQYVNIKKRAAFFAKFSYVEIMAERRNFIRMTVEPNPHTIIESELGAVEGKLYDLSISGLHILVENSSALEIGTEALVSFLLRDIEQEQNFKVTVPAKLINIKGNSMPYSYIFNITVDKTTERLISKYIFQRQLEIIREIKDAAC
ncbi:MAG: PilZ domain-containing protein [Desulfuromonadaceae bacterium]|nr:PilZ domain-containing protein [Desulfuromonadaceae bacterium]MDD2856195.1 PilZ domain-containing protein [Desulfuromonadaceae bacterium]